MTCRHKPGDPNCSSYGDWRKQNPVTPDASSFKIVEVEEVKGHLILKVLYTNCSACAYEGNKVLVYLNTTAKQALFWQLLDPHFRDPALPTSRDQAPPPNARFPANPQGWKHAQQFCELN